MKNKNIKLFEVSEPIPTILMIEEIKEKGKRPRYILRGKVKGKEVKD